MFNFGFSYIGVLYLLLLFIPNLIWVKNKPVGYTSKQESKILGFFEKIGEALCTCCVLIFSDFNLHKSEWIVWFILSILCMALYEIYWIRYFNSEKTVEDFYKPMLGISVPGATLPVVAFFLLGIYGTNIFLILSSVLLGIGHIGIHKQHYKDLNPHKPKRILRVIRGLVLVVCGICFSILSFFIVARNYNYMNHYQLIENGIDEGEYVELGNQKQYVLIRGSNVNNPVILFLHGGPSSPESYVNYSWVNDLLDDYTVIDWDQRGCGRTYEYNKDIDPNNKSATFEQALLDLDDLVEYAQTRFNQDKVILVGHSYGTVLGASYIEQHPEKVSQYVSIAQVVSMDINNQMMVDEALKEAKSDTTNLENAYAKYLENPSVSTTLSLRQEAFDFLPEALPENSVWLALTSPYMGISDFKWLLKQMGPLESYLALNQNLFDSLLDFNLYDINIPKEIPVYYISGTLDYVCPIQSIENYLNKKSTYDTLYTINGCGHNVQYTKPHDVSQIIMDVLSSKGE